MILPKYLNDLRTISGINKTTMAPYGIRFSDETQEGYQVRWGTPKIDSGSTLETGFFWEAAHLDTKGLYQHSSFHEPGVWDHIHDVSSVNLDPRYIKSKYPQTNKQVEWEGVVLASQNPGDRSILSVGTSEDFYQFIEGACKKYGEELFIKLHPWNSTPEVVDRIMEPVKRYGCRAEKCNHSVIEHCRFVLIYNSTFAIDCIARAVPVAQFAPGYFSSLPVWDFTDRAYPDKAEYQISNSLRLLDFLFYHYCFNYAMPPKAWAEMLTAFENSKELFPLPKHLSYGGYNQ